MASSGQLINYASMCTSDEIWNDSGLLENPGSSGKSYISIAPWQYFYISTGSTPFLGTEPKGQLIVNDATWTNTNRTEGYNWRQINDVTIGKSKEQVHQTNKSGGTYEYNVGPGIVLWRPKRIQGNGDRTHFRFVNGGMINCTQAYYDTWWKGQPIYGFNSTYVYLGDTWTVDSPSTYLRSSTTGFMRIASGTSISQYLVRCCYPPMPWM